MRITDEVVKEHHLYKSLEESIEEASDYISYLSSSNEWLTAEMKYLQDFISYKKLDDEYLILGTTLTCKRRLTFRFRHMYFSCYS